MSKSYRNPNPLRKVVVYVKSGLDEEFFAEIEPGKSIQYDGDEQLVFTDSENDTKLTPVPIPDQANCFELTWPDIRTDGMVIGGP